MRNYKRIYRALHTAAKEASPIRMLIAFRIAQEEDWSSTPFVQRKIAQAHKRMTRIRMTQNGQK